MLQQTDQDLGATFARLRHDLCSYLRRRIPNVELAEDLLQDVFVKALASQRAGHKVENVTGWLYAVARTTLVDYYRAAGAPMEMIDENMPRIEAEDLRLHQELSACLMPFVKQLAPIYRETLIATDFEGETMGSLAEKQKVSVSAIKSRASRARTMLKEKLLACCHVEMADGMVSDYRRLSRSNCGGKCA